MVKDDKLLKIFLFKGNHEGYRGVRSLWGNASETGWQSSYIFREIARGGVPYEVPNVFYLLKS